MYLTTYVKESPNGNYKAEVHQDTSGYFIEYYSPDGIKLKTETHYGKSIHYVSSIAENWIDGIKVLNG